MLSERVSVVDHSSFVAENKRLKIQITRRETELAASQAQVLQLEAEKEVLRNMQETVAQAAKRLRAEEAT